MVTPTLMLALSAAKLWILSETVWYSARPMSELPATLTMMPRAPLRSTVSRSGEAMASLAAFSALSSPLASATPMSAVPAFFMTMVTSWKSMLICPGRVTRSEMALTLL